MKRDYSIASGIRKVNLLVATAIIFLSIGISSPGVANEQRPSIVILIHGVRSSGLPGEANYAYAPFRHWASQNLGKAELIDFDWSHGRADFPHQASFRVGHRR